MKGQSVLFTAAGIGVTLICLLGVAWIGPAGAFINLFTPIAAAYISMRYGMRAGIVVVVVTSALLLQLANIYTLGAYVGFFGAGSLLLPFFLRQQVKWDRACLYAIVGSAIVTVTMFIVVIGTNGINLQVLIGQMVQAEVEQAMQIYQDAGFDSNQLQEMQLVIDGMAGFISRCFYGLYLASIMGITAVCLLILNRLKGNLFQIAGTPFAQWRLPAKLIWILIFSGFLFVVPGEIAALIGQNLLVVLLPLYFLQGMAVVSNYLQKKSYPPAVKGLIYLLLVILNPLPVIITCAGVFDLWIDFRRPRKKNI